MLKATRPTSGKVTGLGCEGLHLLMGQQGGGNSAVGRAGRGPLPLPVAP